MTATIAKPRSVKQEDLGVGQKLFKPARDHQRRRQQLPMAERRLQRDCVHHGYCMITPRPQA